VKNQQGTMTSTAAPRQQLRFQNSYRLKAHNPFNGEKVEKILKEVMDNHFSQIDRFDTRTSVAYCRTVTDDVMELIKELKFDRQVT
jgi:hypothetical protein